ncbi:MAG: hypothetical protein WC828_07410 [Thermoleophilia bacterium]
MAQNRSVEGKEPYEAPAFEKFGNLLNITATWQCSIFQSSHERDDDDHHRHGGHH